MPKPKIIIVIPAYNEAKRIGNVLDTLTKHGHKHVIVVDDGSEDETSAVAAQHGATVLTHLVNRGYGAAIKTGLDHAKTLNADVVVTFDADGQHDPTDIAPVIAPILNGTADVVNGARTKNRSQMPAIRRLGNWGLNIITWLFFHAYVTDSQSGFKAYSPLALTKIDPKLDRYEFCSEIMHEIQRNKLRLAEVPITVIYTQESIAKGQSILGGIKTAWGMMKRVLLS